MDDSDHTYSILLRYRRVTTEDAYVSVPVTSDLMKPEPEADGTFRLNTDALWAEGLRISRDSRVEWRVESTETVPHPTQQPKPEDRYTFDPFYFPTGPTN
ncbi:MAG TPA: hypothetical protein VOA87_10730 [Thermoanaerobaculia bacterium]|nr:hypothetical protein [Thermoanaerobaculia bacterium]